MLKSVDILIGFSVIMLVVSIAVTLANQIITSCLNLRGMQLRDGVWRLLRYIDHGIDKGSARVLANLVLKDPILASRKLMGGFRHASVVQREELTILLMRIADGDATELKIRGLPDTYAQLPQPAFEPVNDAQIQAGAKANLPAHIVLIEAAILEEQQTRLKQRQKPESLLERLWNRIAGDATNIE